MNIISKNHTIRYPWEIWSEIIASKLGQALGLRIVDYNLAILNEGGSLTIGCLSKSIIKPSNEFLRHGYEYLRAAKPDFDNEKGEDHSFQLIKEALKSNPNILSWKKYVDEIIGTIVFDSLIGNRDRHQENWAIKWSIVELELDRTRKRFNKLIKKPLKIKFQHETEFSELYDNGSSLGHEIIEKKLGKYLWEDGFENRIIKYAIGPKNTSHIRWTTRN